jgi:hypothetical protein
MRVSGARGCVLGMAHLARQMEVIMGWIERPLNGTRMYGSGAQYEGIGAKHTARGRAPLPAGLGTLKLAITYIVKNGTSLAPLPPAKFPT